MFNIKNLIGQAFLALTLACASSAALAGPAYLVTLHTQAYSGESGLLDFGFLGDAAASAEMVALLNFSGDIGAEFDRHGGVAGDLATGVTFANSGSANYLTQVLSLGGDFSFELRFSDDYAMPADPADAMGLTFVVSLFDSLMTEQLAQFVQFDLMPFSAGEPANIMLTINADLASVTPLVADVPEPAALLLMLSALALAGAAMRRRRV